MIIENKNKIISIEALYPELIGTETAIIERLNYLNCKEEELDNLHQKYRILKEEIDKKQKEFNELSKLYKITYKTSEFEEIKNDVNLKIVNDSDYRNHD